jgi:GH24 family phage-related lysozyme (muramidase)
MSIATHPLAGDLMDDNEFPEMIKREEGSSLTPYYDSAGIPTIGIGINLADPSNLALVLQAVFDGNVPDDAQAGFEAVLSKNYGTTAALDNAMNAQLQTYAGAPSEFKLTPEEEDSIFTTVAAQKVSGLNAILAANGTPLDNNSAEFMALLSLYYNQQSGNPLVGPQLLADLKAGNRAEVWYQIRYRSDAKDPNGGLQKRRFYESAVFSLDGSTSSLAQAEQDYEMLTVHRGTILGKEAATVFQRNQPLQIGVNPDAPTSTYTVLDEANSNYSLTGGSGGAVDAPAEVLGTEFYNEGVLIATDLDSLYGSVLPQIDVTNPSDFLYPNGGSGSFQVSSTDIFIAESAGPVGMDVDAGAGDGTIPGGAAEAAADHIVMGMTGGETLTGGLGNDIIVAGPGNETLNAGVGSDTLIGGSGNDVLNAGQGADVLDLDFTQNPTPAFAVETIVDASGNGKLYVDGSQIGNGTLTPSGNLTWTDGNYQYQFIPDSQIAPGDLNGTSFGELDWGPDVGELKITPTASNPATVGTIELLCQLHAADGCAVPDPHGNIQSHRHRKFAR